MNTRPIFHDDSNNAGKKSCVPAILNICVYITASLDLCLHQRPRCMVFVLAHINNGFWMAHKQKIQSCSSRGLKYGVNHTKKHWRVNRNINGMV
jgi:hypothetical protein